MAGLTHPRTGIKGSWSDRKVCSLLNDRVNHATEFLHVKPGKGSAFVRSKIKSYLTGNTVDKTFRAGEPVSQLDLVCPCLQSLSPIWQRAGGCGSRSLASSSWSPKRLPASMADLTACTPCAAGDGHRREEGVPIHLFRRSPGQMRCTVAFCLLVPCRDCKICSSHLFDTPAWQCCTAALVSSMEATQCPDRLMTCCLHHPFPPVCVHGYGELRGVPLGRGPLPHPETPLFCFALSCLDRGRSRLTSALHPIGPSVDQVPQGRYNSKHGGVGGEDYQCGPTQHHGPGGGRLRSWREGQHPEWCGPCGPPCIVEPVLSTASAVSLACCQAPREPAHERLRPTAPPCCACRWKQARNP